VSTVLVIAFVLLSMSLILSFVRLVSGPTLPDRVISLELLVSVTVGFIAAHTISTERANFLDVAVVLALTAFLAAVAFARFLEQGGPRDD
jgi:multicomponent Na+:H+ antiporter subunit F